MPNFELRDTAIEARDVSPVGSERLRAKCHKLAAIDGVIGRARPDLRPDIRSFPFQNYVILFRYAGKRFEVINIIEGHRDIEALFARDHRPIE